MNLALLKQYLRIDFSDDDDLLTLFVTIAQQFILDSTGFTITYATETEQLAVMLTVAHFYENRNFITTDGAVPQKVPMTLQTLLMQLKAKAGDY